MLPSVNRDIINRKIWFQHNFHPRHYYMVREIVLANAPSGFPVVELGKSDSTFELKELELPELKDDQVLVSASCDIEL